MKKAMIVILCLAVLAGCSDQQSPVMPQAGTVLDKSGGTPPPPTSPPNGLGILGIAGIAANALNSGHAWGMTAAEYWYRDDDYRLTFRHGITDAWEVYEWSDAPLNATYKGPATLEAQDIQRTAARLYFALGNPAQYVDSAQFTTVYNGYNYVVVYRASSGYQMRFELRLRLYPDVEIHEDEGYPDGNWWGRH
ncbi:MAG: hypothetical protein R3D98_11655 [Candidatus Krumholzibacteriia bacterium]